jgi:hypothetical protein
MDEEKIKATERSMLFFDLLVLMRELVRSQLGLIVNPETGETTKDIDSARRLVDMITVLKEKTEGNLNEQEQRVIDNLISELQMACVKAQK